MARQKCLSVFHTTDHDDDDDDDKTVLPAATNGFRSWLRPNHSHHGHHHHHHGHHHHPGNGRLATGPGDESGTARVSRRLFGRAPWHRKGSAGSFGDSATPMPACTKGCEFALGRLQGPRVTWARWLTVCEATGLAASSKSATSQFPGGVRLDHSHYSYSYP